MGKVQKLTPGIEGFIAPLSDDDRRIAQALVKPYLRPGIEESPYLIEILASLIQRYELDLQSMRLSFDLAHTEREFHLHVRGCSSCGGGTTCKEGMLLERAYKRATESKLFDEPDRRVLKEQ